MMKEIIEIKQLEKLYNEIEEIFETLSWYSPCDDSDDWDANCGYTEFIWGLRKELKELLNRAYNLGGAYKSEIIG